MFTYDTTEMVVYGVEPYHRIPKKKAGGIRAGHTEVVEVSPEGVIISTPAMIRSCPYGCTLRTTAVACDGLAPDLRLRRVICDAASDHRQETGRIPSSSAV